MQEWSVSSPRAEYFDHQTEGLDALVREVIATPELAIDTETTGLIIWKDMPLYFSLAWGERHNGRRITLNISALPYFAEAFANPYKRWIFANAKYDAHILANFGTLLAGQLIDIQVMHQLLYEDHPHNLKYINSHLFGWKWADFQDTFGKIGKKQSAEELIRKAERENFDLLVEYAANDAWGTWCGYLELKKQLMAANTHSLFREEPLRIETLYDLFNKVEVPYTKVLWKNERNGVRIDRDYLAVIEPKAAQQLERMEKDLFKMAGRAINFNSPPQLQELFFEQLKLDPVKWNKPSKRTGKRAPSLDKDALAIYAERGVEMAVRLLEYRKLNKLYNDFIVGIGEHIDPFGKIHTTFNQDVARTGRLSSKEPNVQQIPNPERDAWGMRGAFVSDNDDFELIVIDYEQLEMRLLAAASGEPGMIEVINAGRDIHMGNASMIFDLPYEDIVAAKKSDPAKLDAYMRECILARSAAKQLGFAIIYGQGAAATGAAIGVSKQEAEKKIEQFKLTYPAVDAFTQEAIAETEETGYAFTIMGRRRNIPEILSYRRDERAEGERRAVNTQIQGSAADVCKMAQILIDISGIEQRLECTPRMQVHDELMNHAPKVYAAEAQAELVEWMEHPFPFDLPVPLSVSAGHGRSWMDAK